MFSLNAGVKGRFKFEIIKPSGEVEDKGWSDNIVLDQGLRNLGDKNIFQYCRVGEGSSTPTPEQVDLDSQVGATNGTPPGGGRSLLSGVNPSEGYWWFRKTFRFAETQAEGRLTEVGIGWEASGNTLFNRALIRDARGQTTTIVVLGDEVLDVTIELRFYPKYTTYQGNFTSINRLPNGTEEVTSRATRITPLFIEQGHELNTTLSRSGVKGYSGPISSPFVPPTGFIADFKTMHIEPYGGDQTRTYEISWSINEGNSAPLQTIVLPTGIGVFQVQADPPFVKTPQLVLRLQFNLSWSRYE